MRPADPDLLAEAAEHGALTITDQLNDATTAAVATHLTREVAAIAFDDVLTEAGYAGTGATAGATPAGAGFAAAELALEDAGWRRLSAQAAEAFTRAGLRVATARCREMTTLNPLMRRGVGIRVGYVWGDGVQVAARATGDTTEGRPTTDPTRPARRSPGGGAEQDVNATVQAFLDDPSNQLTFTGEQAREESERSLATDGNLFWALFTVPTTGAVQIRNIPWDEITDRIDNPDDASEPWYYVRRWTQVTTTADGDRLEAQQTAYYPDVRYRPTVRPRSFNGDEILWASPIVHTSVNRPTGWKWGVPDVFTAVPWARAYTTFLTDWAQLVKALSKFAWARTSAGAPSRAARAAQQAMRTLNAAARSTTTPGASAAGSVEAGRSDAGGLVDLYGDTKLEAIPKSGATIDSESGRPIAAMIAAGLDLPVTMVLGDPGVTGARAVAETLDEPTKRGFTARRNRRAQELRTVLGYVIRESVRAPRGALRGTITRDDFGRERVTLAGDTDDTIDITFPPLDSVNPSERVHSIVEAISTGALPAEERTRLLLTALGVDDVDSIIEEMRDPDTGEFIPPDEAATASAGQAAVDAFRRGSDPVAALTGEPTRAPTTTPAPAPAAPARGEPAATREAAPAHTRQRVLRDPAGNITEIITEAVPAPAPTAPTETENP